MTGWSPGARLWWQLTGSLALAGALSAGAAGATLWLVAGADGVAAGRSWGAVLAAVGPGWRVAGPVSVAVGMAAVAARWRAMGWVTAMEIVGWSPRRWLAAALVASLLVAPFTVAVELGCGDSPREWSVGAAEAVAPDGRRVNLASLEVRRGAPPPAVPQAVGWPVVAVQSGISVVLVAAMLDGVAPFVGLLAISVALTALWRASPTFSLGAVLVALVVAAVARTGRRSQPAG
jgi:hypothetical protein